MTITTLHSALKIAAAPNSKPEPNSNNIHLRIRQAWQGNASEKTETAKTNQPNVQPKISATEQSTIDKFIESMHSTHEKKDLFILLSKQLRGLSAAEREKFISGLVSTLKTSEQPRDQTLLKEKFNPAYSMYIAGGIFVNQMNQESLSKIGQMPKDEDDDDSDEI
ncbi:hypothetical protein [Yersinia massiliensis]|uniref:hypothetical protein n=1 Tax=Yersinia massiliensis TaxID=419257 RepID=UPI0006857058|nr:hypothetical protein [Yersinia massiliensis]